MLPASVSANATIAPGPAIARKRRSQRRQDGTGGAAIFGAEIVAKKELRRAGLG